MRNVLPEDLTRYSDSLRTREGTALTVRFAEPRDAEELQHYFRSLSARSRYNRFFGAMTELPHALLDRFVHISEDDGLTAIATMVVDGFSTILAEARYVLHPESRSLEFGLSVHDRWQGQGIGAALLGNLECRAAALGAQHMVGDTLRSNAAMLSLARKAGFALAAHPNDWKLVRFEKAVAYAPAEIPCATWRMAVAARALADAAA